MPRYVRVSGDWLDRYEKLTDSKTSRPRFMCIFLASFSTPQAVIQPILNHNYWLGLLCGVVGLAAMSMWVVLFVRHRRAINKLLHEMNDQ